MILGFEIASDYGHFSHPATIYSSLTYPVPPKTTVMGMLGAVAGLAKMDVYDKESYEPLNKIKYSVVIKQLDGKMNFCFNGIKNALPSIDLKNGVQKVTQRKQFYRELLIAPRYEIFIDFTDIEHSEIINTIAENLSNNRSHYQLYMGINFCLASVKYIGIFEKPVQNHSDDYVKINSFIHLNEKFRIEPDKNYTDIRMATTISKGRIFGGYTNLLVETTGQSILCECKEFTQLDNRNLAFI